MSDPAPIRTAIIDDHEAIRLGVGAALQQHTAGHLQASPLQKPFSGHHLATRYAAQIGRYTFNLINAGQSLCE